MPDHKPPRLNSGERATLHALLQYQRESLVRKVRGIDEHAARHAFVGSGLTVLWLTKHMARAELVWIVHRFAAEDLPAGDLDDAVRPGDTLAAAITYYRATWARVDAIVAGATSLDELARRPSDDPPVNLRWILAHLLEETARHAGHADIVRELIDGQTGR